MHCDVVKEGMLWIRCVSGSPAVTQVVLGPCTCAAIWTK